MSWRVVFSKHAQKDAKKLAGSGLKLQTEKLIALLREHGGNISAVARAMGKARMQIQRWLKRYRLDPETYR